MMEGNRLEEIQRMFEEMGLGSPKERERFKELSGESWPPAEEDPGEHQQEQIFIRLENATSSLDVVTHG